MLPNSLTMDSQEASSPAPYKIAMKSFSLKTKVSTSTNATNKPRDGDGNGVKTVLGKRPRSALKSTGGDSEDEEYDGYERGGAYEEVTAFDSLAGGAVCARDGDTDRNGRNGGGNGKANGPLVIERVKNTDWKSEVRRRTQGRGGKNLLPKEVQEARKKNGATEEEEIEGDGDVKWGLTFTKKKVEESGDTMVLDTTTTTTTVTTTSTNTEKNEEESKTEDDLALDALLGKTPKAPDLIIERSSSNPNLEEPFQNENQPLIPKNETDAYRLAVASAPLPSTLDEYELVPVADFGAALLRGMGWKGEGHEGRNGKKKREVKKRRPNLLGLGADEKMVGEAEELGAWVQRADVGRLRGGARGGGRGGSGGKGFVKPGDYKREKERVRESRESREGSGRDGGGSRDRDRSRERDRGSRRDDRDRDRDRDRDYRRR